MNHMILGTILVISGLGLMKFDYGYMAIISIGFGVYFLMKGRGEIDTILPPKPWEKD